MKVTFFVKGASIFMVGHFLLTFKWKAARAEEVDSELYTDFEDYDWNELPGDVRDYYVQKGWNEQVWETGDVSLMDHYNESDFSWDELPTDKRDELIKRGWNEEAWNKNDISLMAFYNEEEMTWDQLPQHRREYWMGQGYTQESFQAAYTMECDSDSFRNAAERNAGVFAPALVNVSIPSLQQLDLNFYETLDIKIGLKAGGYNTEPNDDYLDESTFREFLPQVRAGSTTQYFVVEDKDVYKDLIKDHVEGEGNIIELVRQALVERHVEAGFLPEWHNLTESKYDWAMWIGAKGTKSPMHYDTDTYNFLYVVEGKKKVVLIPNDDSFVASSVGNGVAYTGIDVLSPGAVLPEKAVVYEVGPGEGLVIPHLAWHAVENLEPTIAYGWRVL